jgi:tetratricopeptide (TPR) repeat protein
MNSPVLPFRSFVGKVKRMRLDENETMASLVMDLAFPHFRDVSEMTAKAQRFYQQFYGEDAYAALSLKPKRRRFSGGDSLPRGRYYTVCYEFPALIRSSQSARFHDGNVLKNELHAYSNDPANRPVFLLDYQSQQDRDAINRFNIPLDDQETSSRLSHEDDFWHKMAVCFLKRQGHASIIELILDAKERDPDFKNDGYGGSVVHLTPATPHGDISSIQVFNLYYKFEKVRIDKVIDLRYPDTQRALVDIFFPEFKNSVPRGGAVGDFCMCLPSLIASPLGGTEVTERIGTFFRAIGANAFVYPSARYNSFVRFRNGQLEQYSGWNLVDYRNTERPEFPDLSRRVTWTPEKHIRVEVPAVSEDFGFGSWRVRGVLEQAETSYDQQSLQFFGLSETQEQSASTHEERERAEESLSSQIQACRASLKQAGIEACESSQVEATLHNTLSLTLALREVGRENEALSLAKDAIELMQVVGVADEDVQTRYFVAKLNEVVGVLLLDRDHIEKAVSFIEIARIELHTALLATQNHALLSEYMAVSRTYLDVSSQLRQSGKPAGADPVFSVQEYIGLGDCWIQEGNVTEAIACFEKALDVTEELITYDVEPFFVEHTKSIAFERLGDCLFAQDRPRDAVERFSKCLKIRLQLYEQHATSHTRKDLGLAYARLGAALVGDAQADAGVSAHAKSAEHFEGVIRTEGIEYEDMEILGHLAIAYLNIALCLREANPEIFMDRMLAAYGLADELASRGRPQVMQNPALCVLKQKVDDGALPAEVVREARRDIMNELRSSESS